MTEASEDLVVAVIGGCPFALPMDVVEEVQWMVQPTVMPSWPRSGLGVINVRGELLPLVDANEALARPPAPLSPDQFVVLMRTHGRRWGVRVDRVEGVRQGEVIPPGTVAPEEVLHRPALCRGILHGTPPMVVLEPGELIRALRIPEIEPAADGR